MLHVLWRLVACAVLGWQAEAAAAGLWRLAAARAEVGWDLRLVADTDTRLARALGADAPLLFALRDAVPAGSLLITQKIMGRIEDIKSPADFERLNARNGLLVQLTTLLYPDPFLLPVPDPLPVVEEQVRRGAEVALCVLPGDRTPVDRPGWSCTHDSPTFQLWHFRKD